jgi:hypothetical protein
MGFNTVLTPDDLKKGDLVEPGWYPVLWYDYSEKEAGTDKSTNLFFHFKIVDGPSKGVSPQKMFNEKALGFGKNLWNTLKDLGHLKYDAEKGYNLSSELFKELVRKGIYMEIYIKRGKSDKGNDFNDVSDFRPIPKKA